MEGGGSQVLVFENWSQRRPTNPGHHRDMNAAVGVADSFVDSDQGGIYYLLYPRKKKLPAMLQGLSTHSQSRLARHSATLNQRQKKKKEEDEEEEGHNKVPEK